MRVVKCILVLVLVLFVATDVFAEDKKWSDQAEFSYVETGGNTEVKTVSLKNTGQCNIFFLYGNTAVFLAQISFQQCFYNG